MITINGVKLESSKKAAIAAVKRGEDVKGYYVKNQTDVYLYQIVGNDIVGVIRKSGHIWKVVRDTRVWPNTQFVPGEIPSIIPPFASEEAMIAEGLAVRKQVKAKDEHIPLERWNRMMAKHAAKKAKENK